MFPLVMLIKYFKKNLGYKPSYGVVLLILPAWGRDKQLFHRLKTQGNRMLQILNVLLM